MFPERVEPDGWCGRGPPAGALKHGLRRLGAIWWFVTARLAGTGEDTGVPLTTVEKERPGVTLDVPTAAAADDLGVGSKTLAFPCGCAAVTAA